VRGLSIAISPVAVLNHVHEDNDALLDGSGGGSNRGGRGAACHGLVLAAPPGGGPVTDGRTLLGALQALPDRPAYCGFAAKGGVKLAWTGADGKPRTRTVPVIKPLTRVELAE